MTCEKAPDAEEEERSPTKKAQMLMRTELVKESLFEELERMLRENNAQGDEKWAVYKYKYCAAWGIKDVTGKFLKENRTNWGSEAVHMCMRLLYP